jgi:hypothetical protein
VFKNSGELQGNGAGVVTSQRFTAVFRVMVIPFVFTVSAKFIIRLRKGVVVPSTILPTPARTQMATSSW